MKWDQVGQVRHGISTAMILETASPRTHKPKIVNESLNIMPNLAPFHSGQVENFYLLVLGQVQMYQAKLYNSIFHIMINYNELTSCIENSGDPDQLASSGAS